MHGLFRCRICGEVYFGIHPSHCPYCGAHGWYLVDISEWVEENDIKEISRQDRKNLETTRRLEFDNTRFYRAASKKSKNPEITGFFKYLAKIENEHYNVVCKILNSEKDTEIFEPSEELGSDLKNLERSKENEEHAARLYADFIPKTEDKRIKEVFLALSEVESDHVDLDIQEITVITEKDI